jgi:hypothetical protein
MLIGIDSNVPEVCSIVRLPVFHRRYELYW